MLEACVILSVIMLLTGEIFVWTPINDTGVLGGDKLRRLGGGDLHWLSCLICCCKLWSWQWLLDICWCCLGDRRHQL